MPFFPDIVEEEEEEEDKDSDCNGLYQQRILILGAEITSELANILTGALIFFSLKDPTKRFRFFINSFGGSVIDGVAIYDTIDTLRAPVETIVMGMAASMACFILSGGTVRIAFPNARVMMHQPSSPYLDEKNVDIFLEVDQIQKMRAMIVDGFRRRTLQSAEKIIADMEKDLSMSAIEAQEYGLVDIIAEEGEYGLNWSPISEHTSPIDLGDYFD
uniref:ATP-dependent Clp protease proteolytic subunit n=1 Tax=Adenocalymma candolleanum TaxID=3013920 RepID=A0A2H4RGA2_9LAMI|nr:clp protease proteolytic subunit [Adenocalymma candolleanum]ATY48567.1 clp protease proteolytic subunit [Adenocalymma candolleanum]